MSNTSEVFIDQIQCIESESHSDFLLSKTEDILGCCPNWMTGRYPSLFADSFNQHVGRNYSPYALVVEPCNV